MSIWHSFFELHLGATAVIANGTRQEGFDNAEYHLFIRLGYIYSQRRTDDSTFHTHMHLMMPLLLYFHPRSLHCR